MGAEPWLDEIRRGINLSISFGCDYWATTRRKRDVTLLAFSEVAGPADDVGSGVKWARSRRRARMRMIRSRPTPSALSYPLFGEANETLDGRGQTSADDPKQRSEKVSAAKQTSDDPI
jgi:hypothetical protein